MKSLTVQILVDGQWQDAAELTLSQPERGAASPTTLGYNLDYALRWMERDDEHACGLNLPVAVMIAHEAPQWLRFLEDIVPSGAARRYWVNYLGLQSATAAQQDTALLEKGTIAPVGNLRIKEALPPRREDSTLHLRRFNVTDVIERHTDFLEYAQQMGAIGGGATGAGGEAPKLLLRCSKENVIWIDTYQEDFTNSDEHYLVKFPRGNRGIDDCDILRAEYHFYHELEAMGMETIATKNMRLMEGERYPSLWLPRFDVCWHDGKWQRYGLESVLSILDKPAGSYLNHFDTLDTLCKLLGNRSEHFDQQAFVCEWVKRDLLNIAFANSDNHGRNSAFIKNNGAVRLSPIYDFAPMKADPEGITRTMTWGSPYEEGGEYRWEKIAEKLDSLCPSEKILQTLRKTAGQLQGLKSRLQQRGVPERIISMPAVGFDFLDQKLKRWSLI